MLLATDVDFYFSLRFENSLVIKKIEDRNKVAKKSKLIFNIDCFIGIQKLCIPFDVAIKVTAMAHRDNHSGFAKYYEIVARLWYI